MNHSPKLLGRILALASFSLMITISFDDVVARAEECLGTGADMDAEGKATARIRQSNGKLKLRASKLDASGTFSITVDGVQIGSMTTNGAGRGRTRFSSKVGSKDQLLGVDPRGARVAVSDDEGEDVLECDIPEDDDGEPDGIRCCIPHEGESECEHFTVEHCEAEGGTNAGAGSCFPDPCEDDSPSGEAVRCCFPDEDGAQCLALNAELCSHEDGISLGAGSCDPNPCPPPAPPPRCCLVIEGENVCEDFAPEHCAAEGGTDIGPGGCEPNPCS